MRTSVILHALFAGWWIAFVGDTVMAEELPTPLFAFSLRAVDPALLPKEPLVLEGRMENVSGVRQAIPRNLDHSSNALQYEITQPGGKSFRYEHWFRGDSSTLVMKELAPKEVLVFRALLHHSPKGGFLFAEPGQYTVRAACHAWLPEALRASLRSNAVAVDVRPAAGDDAAALKLFSGNKPDRFAFGGIRLSDTSEFDVIIGTYPKTAYAPWAHYFLARAWQRDDQTPPRMRGEKATALYEKLLKDYPKFPLADEVPYEIAKEMVRQGQTERGLERIEELFRQRPQFHFLQEAHRIVKGYRESGYWVTADGLP